MKIKGENPVEMKLHDLDMNKASFEVTAIHPGKYLGHYKEVEQFKPMGIGLQAVKESATNN